MEEQLLNPTPGPAVELRRYPVEMPGGPGRYLVAVAYVDDVHFDEIDPAEREWWLTAYDGDDFQVSPNVLFAILGWLPLDELPVMPVFNLYTVLPELPGPDRLPILNQAEFGAPGTRSRLALHLSRNE